MAGERLILLVNRVLNSRTFWRWAGVPLGIAGLAVAGILIRDADLPGVDPGTRNAQLSAAGLAGLVGLVLVCFGAASWARRSPPPPAGGSPDAEPGAASSLPRD